MKSFIVIPTLFFLYGTPSQGSYLHVDESPYINQVRSLEISLDETVDFTKSSFLFQDEPLQFYEPHASLFLKEEGKNVLQYTLVDRTGKCIEQGEKVWILDTQEPKIDGYVGAHVLNETIGVIDSQEIHFQIQEDYIESIELWVDHQKRFETQDASFSWTVTKEDHIVECIVKDKAGHVTKKTYTIEAIEPMEIKTSLLDQGYTLPSQHSITMSSSTLKDWIWVQEIQGQTQYFPCQTMYFHQQVDQDQTWMCIHKTYPYLKAKIDGKEMRKIKVINQPIQCLIKEPIFQEGGKWILPLEYDKNLIQSGKVIFQFQDQRIEKDLASTYEISQWGIDTMDVTIQIEDIFQRKSEYRQRVRWDQTSPTYQIKINGQLVSSNAFVFSKVPRVEMIYDEPVFEKMQYQIDGRFFSFSSIQEALSSLEASKTLVCTITLEDAYFNQTAFQLQFTKIIPTTVAEPIKKVEMVKEETMGNDQKKIIRTFTYEPQSQKIMHEEKKTMLDTTQPRIEILQNLKPLDTIIESQDRIRICLLDSHTYSKDRFVLLKINQESIDPKKIKTDALGRQYYEFIVQDRHYEIEIIAKDASGNMTKMTKTLTVQDHDAMILVWVAGVCLVALFVYRKQKSKI